MPDVDLTPHRSIFTFLLCGFVALAVGLPSLSWAADPGKLTEVVPADSRFVGHVDVDGLEKSKYFDQAVEFIKDSPQTDEEFAAFFDGTGEIDIRSDLDTLAVGLPVARLDRAKEDQRRVFALEGDFDEEKIKGLVEENYSDVSTRKLDDETTVYAVGEAEFAVPNSDRLVVAVGPESYRKTVWSLVQGNGTSFRDKAKSDGLLEGVDTSRAVWMLSRVSKSMRGPSSNVQTATVSLDLVGGLDLQVVSHVGSESNAKSMMKRLEAMKKSGANNPMLGMFGATPLIENLEIDRDNTTVTADTSMTESELDTLISKVKQYASSQSQFSLPSDGAESPTEEKTNESKSDDTENESEE